MCKGPETGTRLVCVEARRKASVSLSGHSRRVDKGRPGPGHIGHIVILNLLL